MFVSDSFGLIAPDTLNDGCPQQSAGSAAGTVVEEPPQALGSKISKAVAWIIRGYHGDSKAHVMLPRDAIDEGNRFLRLVHQLRGKTLAQ